MIERNIEYRVKEAYDNIPFAPAQLMLVDLETATACALGALYIYDTGIIPDLEQPEQLKLIKDHLIENYGITSTTYWGAGFDCGLIEVSEWDVVEVNPEMSEGYRVGCYIKKTLMKEREVVNV